jgi:hypothetical protein
MTPRRDERLQIAYRKMIPRFRLFKWKYKAPRWNRELLGQLTSQGRVGKGGEKSYERSKGMLAVRGQQPGLWRVSRGPGNDYVRLLYVSDKDHNDDAKNSPACVCWMTGQRQAYLEKTVETRTRIPPRLRSFPQGSLPYMYFLI